MTSSWTPRTPTPASSRRRRVSALAPTVALTLSAGLFVAVLTTGGQPVATAETVAPERGAPVTVAPTDVGAVSGEGDHPSPIHEAVAPSRASDTPTRVSTPIAPRQTAARGSQAASRAARPSSAKKPATTADVPAGSASATPGVSSVPVAAPPAAVSTTLGFDPARALGFANWAGDGARVTVAMLIRMFGASAVCATGTQADCVPRTSASRLLEEFNAQLDAGRCEGMVAMVGLALEAGRDLSGVDRARADDEIAYWSLSQVAPRVAARADATRTMVPSRIVSTVATRIAERRTVSLLVWGEGTAHAVLPVAVRHAGALTEIDVWDPNSPGRLGTLVVDTAAETWTYADALDATGAKVGVRVTGAGSLGLVENDLRVGEHRARFAD